MAKWKSPIFSDIRNKLGDNVVFSMWKGRQYMRSYVKPANPNSVAQQANRQHMQLLVARYQTYIKTDGALVTLWNAAALPQLISGYNRFIKGMRGVVISSVTLAHATFEMSIDSSALPADNLQIYTLVSGGASVKKGPLVAVAVVTSADWVDAWIPASGDALWVIDTKVAGATAITPANLEDYGAPLYNVDELDGSAIAVVLT